MFYIEIKKKRNKERNVYLLSDNFHKKPPFIKTECHDTFQLN